MAKQIRNRQANTDQKLPDTPHTGCPQSFGKATILDSLFACINRIRQLIFNTLPHQNHQDQPSGKSL